MITLKNIDNTVELQLDIIDYQFPDGMDDWCLLKVIVKQDDNLFEKIDPSLEVADIHQLYHWFNTLAQGQLPACPHLYFTEPCLSLSFISYINQVVKISITLNNEIKPNFTLNNTNNLTEDWTLYFDLSDKHFAPILKTIQQWIQIYPSRED